MDAKVSFSFKRQAIENRIKIKRARWIVKSEVHYKKEDKDEKLRVGYSKKIETHCQEASKIIILFKFVLWKRKS